MNATADSLVEATRHHRRGELTSALQLYRQILRIDPTHVEALCSLGTLAMQQRQYAEAARCFREAAEAAPAVALYHHHLGTALLELSQLEEAAESLQRAQSLYAEHAETLLCLGTVHERRRQPQKAFPWYLQAVQLDPECLAARRGLSRVLEMLGRIDEAAAICLQTLDMHPNEVETLNQLACLMYRQGAREDSAALFKRALEADPGHVKSWLNLGSAFVASRQLAEAEECFQRVTQLDAENTDGWLNLANVRKAGHRVDEAAAAYREATRRLSPQPSFDLWPLTLCPAVFAGNDEIDGYRERLHGDLGRLQERGICFDVMQAGATFSPPPINLQFQGRDNRQLLEQFAELFQCGLPQDLPRVPRYRRPTVGFVVTGGHEEIFLRYLGGTLTRLASKEFDSVIVCPEASAATLRRELQGSAIKLLCVPYQFAAAVETIRKAAFDVLYHWETGTDVANYFLPFCRLAPVQCVSFGNSETSGIGQIDYFISSSLFEPPDGETHYTERLLPLECLGSYHRRLPQPAVRRSREEFGCTRGQHLYVCAQKPQKIHPDFDSILADILRRDERGVVVLVEDEHRAAGELLRNRFRRSMADVAGRVVFQPRLGFDDYLSLLSAADVLLDPLHYGGGLTMYDALSLDRPVVTLPGRFARGRYAAGIYRRMELCGLTAASAEDYASIAVRLACESDYRHSVELEIRERSPLVFEDARVVAEYEQLFGRLVAEARARMK